MAHTLLLTLNGVAPAAGVCGIAPRDHFELDNSALDGEDTVTTEMARDKAGRQLMIAKSAAIRSVAERRVAFADRSRPQTSETADLKVGSLVELHGQPTPKDAPSWRRPAVLLGVDGE
eukprot:7872635-Pyramimonas_sp.AAC.1